MARRSILILIFVNVSVFLFSAIVLCLANGGVVPTQVYKYPPSIYYLSYALSVSLLIWLGVGLVDKLLTIFGV